MLQYSAGTVVITDVLEIEEIVSSPKWGMVGRIDATVNATIQSHQPTAKVNEEEVRIARQAPVQVESGPMPFEVKGGWCHTPGETQHRAQTMMYTLLMEERYRTYMPREPTVIAMLKPLLLLCRNANHLWLTIFRRKRLDAQGFRHVRRDPISANATQRAGGIWFPTKIQTTGSHCSSSR